MATRLDVKIIQIDYLIKQLLFFEEELSRVPDLIDSECNAEAVYKVGQVSALIGKLKVDLLEIETNS